VGSTTPTSPSCILKNEQNMTKSDEIKEGPQALPFFIIISTIN
jgi:hypothetical protein